ncbi:lipopolysaccharide biosynthesis protein [Neobacillus sp. SAB-20_R2A]|uniref:lipopolysaccharide biosynthesis protein n=1 Tax=Neobacillus sp. SAB-20_R2A TaxID=3120519 RepID=UPI003C6DBEBC
MKVSGAVLSFPKTYNKMSKPVKASVWFMVGSFLQKGISFLTIPIFTRLLSTEEYGIVSVYTAWSSILVIFATLNLSGGVYNRGLLKYEENKFTASLQGLSTVFAISLLLIYLLFHNSFYEFTKLSHTLMLTMLICFIFLPGINFWYVGQRFKFEYKNVITVTIFSTILTTVVTIAAVYFSENRGFMNILAMTIMPALIAVPFYLKNFLKGKKFFDKEIWKYALVFNLPLVPHYLSNLVLSQSDRIMINNLAGSNYAAIYSVAYSVAMIMIILCDSINASLTPWRYQKLEQKEYKEIGDASQKTLILIGSIIVLFNIFAPEIIRLFTPPSYHEAIWVIPPIILSVYFIFLYSFFSNVEFYFMKTKFMMLASVAAAALNILLNYIFIPIYGYLAAGYTTLFCYVIFTIAHFGFMKKVCKENIGNSQIYDMKKILLITLTICFLTAASTLLYNLIMVKFILLAIILILIVVMRNKITNVIRKVVGKREKEY